jgi:hypothetical protein
MAKDFYEAIFNLLRVLMFLSMLVACVFLGYAFITKASVEKLVTSAERLVTQAKLDALTAKAPWVLGILVGLELFLLLLHFFGSDVSRMLSVFGSDISKEIERILYLGARSRYLNSLLRTHRLQIAGSSPMESRVGSEKVKLPLYRMLITGTAGMGKSTFLRQLLVAVSGEVLNGNSDLVPILIDLDVIVELGLPLPSWKDKLICAQNGQTFLVNWMLRRAADEGNLCFILDGSVRLARPSSQQMIDELKLANFVRAYNKCRFVLALPSQVAQDVRHYLVNAGFRDELSLDSLSKKQMREWLEGLAGETGDSIYRGIQGDLTWLSLARKPFMLSMIVKYYTQTGRLPTNVVELFRETSYPNGNFSVTDLESILSRLALQMNDGGRSAVPVTEVQKIAKEVTTAASAKETSRQLLQSNILILFESGKRKSLVKFSHPLFMAFFIAVAWRDGLMKSPDKEEGMEFTRDPLLSEAFVFFNHLESDTFRFADLLSKIVNRRDVFSLYLAASSVLAQPEHSRFPPLVKKIAERLVEGIANFDDLWAERFWLLLENWNLQERLNVYSRVLADLEPTRRIKTLSRIGALAMTDLKAIFLHADETLSRDAGRAWINLNQTEALEGFIDVYESGPDDKRYLAVEMIGRLPSEDVEDVLHSILHEETDPQMRIITLRSLEKSGSESILTMLGVVTNFDESEDVRACAAEILARSGSRELETQRAIKDIMITLSGQIAAQIRSPLHLLLDRLRAVRPEAVEQCEVSINPYIVGRPVLDEKMFFGREDFIHEIKASIMSDNIVLIYGERRIGKSSILRQLSWRLRNDKDVHFPVVPVYIDLQGWPEQGFFPRFISAVVEGGNIPKSVVSRPSGRGKYSYWNFDEDLGLIIEYLMETEGKDAKLALLLDEVDVMIDYPQEMQSQLRSTFGGDYSRNLAIVLAGVAPVVKWTRPDSPFYNMFQWYEVPPLAPDDAQALITVPVASTCEYDPEAIGVILEYSQCKPHAIQSICQRVVGQVLLKGHRQVTANDVRNVYEHHMRPYVLRKGLIGQLEASLEALLDWAESDPDALATHLEEQVETLLIELEGVIREGVSDLLRERGVVKKQE